MAFMRGEPLVTKLAALAKYYVLPGSMVAALLYSPPDYYYSSKTDKSSKYCPLVIGVLRIACYLLAVAAGND